MATARCCAYRHDMTEPWDDIADWWVDAVRDDPTQGVEMVGVLRDLIAGTGGRTIDLGCGDGAAFAELGDQCVGTDSSHELLRHAVRLGPVVRSNLPDLSWIRPASMDRAVALGLVDLVEDLESLLAAVRQAVRLGGHLVVVVNHPVMTSPGSEPLVDPTGEVLWRWGAYLAPGSWPQEAGGRSVTLFHRPMGVLLSAAAAAGWSLEHVVEHGPSEAALARFPEYRGQDQMPTLLGLRWVAVPGTSALLSRLPSHR